MRAPLSAILICCLGIIVYSNTFHVPLQFDDKPFIIDNPAIRNIQDLWTIWKFYPSRFVTFLSIALNYHFNQLDVFGYHLFNLGVHLVAALLVWWLTLLTLSTPAMQPGTVEKKLLPKSKKNLPVLKLPPQSALTGQANFIALFVGLVFVSHPVQTEAVTYIWQRAASLAALFYIASLCFYVKSRLLSRDAINGVSTAALGKFYYICSLSMAIAAMFTKENAITLPLAILLYEICFLNKGRDAINGVSTHWKRLFPFLLSLFIIPLTISFTKSEMSEKMQGVVGMAATGISPMHYLLTQFRVMVTYIRLVFVPINQNLDYDFPVYKSFFELPVLTSFLFLASVLYFAKRLFSKYRLVSFSIFWFFLTSLPESSFLPLQDVIFEHRLYLPLVGYSLFLVSGIYYLLFRRDAINGVSTTVIALTMIVACNAVLTYQRNKAWKDEITLLDDTIQKSPHKSRPYNNRGYYYYERDNFIQALSDYNKAVEFHPTNGEPYNNRGNIYSTQGNFTQAMSDYNKALEMNPEYAEAYNNRGLTYYKQNNLTQSLSDYNKAIALNPNYAQAYSNRGLFYDGQGNLAGALSDYNKALALDPTHAETYYSRGFVLVRQNNFIQAIPDFTRAIELNPDYAAAYNNRGRIYDIQNDLTQALSDYNKAIELNSKLGMAYVNRAVIYYKTKEYASAWNDVQKAEKLGAAVNPGLINALKEALKIGQ